MVSELEQSVRQMDDSNRSVYALSGEIAQNLGLSKYTCRNYLLAKRKGYSCSQAYRDEKLKQRGFSNSYAYLQYQTEKKGFSSYKEYQKFLHEDKTSNKIGFIGIQNVQQTPLEIAEKKEARKIIKGIIARLKPRIRTIIEKRFYEGATLQQCARKFRLTRERIRQLEEQTLERLANIYALKQLAEAS